MNEGAFFHSDWWPFRAGSRGMHHRHEASAGVSAVWILVGMQGHMAFNLWEFYRYNPTTNNLNKVWPALREFAGFCALLGNTR